MSEEFEAVIKEVCLRFHNDRTRMLDIVRETQHRFGCVSSAAWDLIASHTAAHRVDVESVVSFYAFLSEAPRGRIVVRLCNDVIDQLKGFRGVARAFTERLGIGLGETTPDGRITLETTPCIGLCDQAPAALVNEVPLTHLTRGAARNIAKALLAGATPQSLVRELGTGNNAHELVRSMVTNNIRERGDVIFDDFQPGAALSNALAVTSDDVIRELTDSKLRGRGGAGFPTGLKLNLARGAGGAQRYVMCNADEGEPGTFKDRVILTERPDLMFEGMTIAGFAVGANMGIVYLRAEYAYLHRYLEHVLERRRKQGLLGERVCGKDGFDFEIRVQLGAGAYICGEETALISSCEGRRGDPKNRPPFPARKGYLSCPTAVNNVETLCCIARILERDAEWFAGIGNPVSTGTKLLSVSGDCPRPGVYELPFGMTLSEVLELAGAENSMAVQVGGPSGQLVGPADFKRTIGYDDLATGGSLMVFGQGRDLPRIAATFLEFFIDESCGYCTPCRVGNVLLKERLDRIIAGRGEPRDLEYLRDLGNTIKTMSRCGLGQSSANPVLSGLRSFPAHYQERVKENEDGVQPHFDLEKALAPAALLAGR